MSRYTVQMSFEVPGLPGPVFQTHRSLGRALTMRLIGSEGTLAVTANVHAESPAEAAMLVAGEAAKVFGKRVGGLRLLAWKAHREKAFAGLRRHSSTVFGGSGTLTWDDEGWHDEGDEGGSAGVREPRRPLPGPGSLHAERQE